MTYSSFSVNNSNSNSNNNNSNSDVSSYLANVRTKATKIFLSIKERIEICPVLTKAIIYYSLFIAFLLNVFVRIDDRTLFTPRDVIINFEWWRLFTSCFYVPTGLISSIFIALIAHRFVSELERSLGTTRSFLQLLVALVLVNSVTALISLILAPFYFNRNGRGGLMSQINISGPGIISAIFTVTIGNIVRNSSNAPQDALVFGFKVSSQMLPFMFLFFWWILGNNLIEGVSCVFVAIRYLPKLGGVNGAPSAQFAKRFENTKLGKFISSLDGFVNVDGEQFGIIHIPVSIRNDIESNNTMHTSAAAAFSGTSQKLGVLQHSMMTNTLPARENIHVVRLREEREREQHKREEEEREKTELERKLLEKDEIMKPLDRIERANLVADALEKRLNKQEVEVRIEPSTDNTSNEQKDISSIDAKKKSRLRSPFRRGSKSKDSKK